MSKQKKKFYFDVIQNTFAFGIYIAAFHLLMMPYLARHLEPSVNAKLLLFIMISNVLTVTLGNELGVLYQILEGRKPGRENVTDLWIVLNGSNVLLGLFIAVVLWILGFDAIAIIALTITAVFGNVRFFLQGYLRQNKDFRAIALGNMCYLAGAVAALLVFLTTGVVYWVPVFLAELFSIIYLMYHTRDISMNRTFKGDHYKGKLKEYLELAGATILTNIPNYSDKMLVLPMLGDLTMSAYYAGTVLSKMMFLIVNPINAVLLSWLSSDRTTNEDKVINNQIRANIIILIFVFGISFPLTYILIRLFYGQFLTQILSIILPLSLISGFSIASSFLRVVFLRYFDLKMLKYINLFQLVLFFLIAPLGAVLFGLQGFTYGVAASKGVLWLTFLVMLRKGNRWRVESSPISEGTLEI